VVTRRTNGTGPVRTSLIHRILRRRTLILRILVRLTGYAVVWCVVGYTALSGPEALAFVAWFLSCMALLLPQLAGLGPYRRRAWVGPVAWMSSIAVSSLLFYTGPLMYHEARGRSMHAMVTEDDHVIDPATERDLGRLNGFYMPWYDPGDQVSVDPHGNAAPVPVAVLRPARALTAVTATGAFLAAVSIAVYTVDSPRPRRQERPLRR